MDTNLIIAQILKTNTNIQAIAAQLQSRVTQVIEMNRQITDINDKINLLYCHLNTLKTLQATQKSKTQFKFESNSMTNDVELNAESDLHHNQDDKEILSNYERQYGRLHYNSDFQADRWRQRKSNQHQAPLLSHRTKVDNYCIVMFNIFLKYNLNLII